MCDGAEVFDQFAMCHADAEVLNGNGAGFFIGGDLNLQVEVRIEDVFFGDLSMAQLFGCVRGVRDQFEDEDFLIGVKRMDNDIEDLLDLGLEFVAFRCYGAHSLFLIG